MALSWCKVASNLDSHPKIRKAGREGREVFLFALRRNAEPGNKHPGSVSADELDPDYLAYELMSPRDVTVTGVTACVTAGLLAPNGDRFDIVGWEEDWGKVSGSSAERMARWRENKKLQAQVTPVTSRDVTVTPSDTDQKRREEKRLEETRVVPRKRGTPLPADWRPSDSEANRKAETAARTRGLDIEDQLTRMRDHAAAQGWRKADWEATWRNWTRSPYAKPTGNNVRGLTPLEAQLERVRMLEAQEAASQGEIP